MAEQAQIPDPPPDVDPEVWLSLPDEIRAEILRENARQAHAPATTSTSAPSGDQDASANPRPPQSGMRTYAQFLDTLAPDLRRDVLLTATPEDIAEMPAELRAEVDRIRAQAAAEQGHSDRAHAREGTGQGVESDRDDADEDQIMDVDATTGFPPDTLASPEVPGKSVLRSFDDAAMLVKLLMHRGLHSYN
ncbi:MAG TPA: hypothetical protein VEF04_18090, partial [Blastocatellia bacterium]|nr:hypothetical protein [Blastocatellia bacterium]